MVGLIVHTRLFALEVGWIGCQYRRGCSFRSTHIFISKPTQYLECLIGPQLRATHESLVSR